MIKSNIIGLSLIILFTLATQAQNIDEIKNNKNYIWGLGSGTTLNQADQLALQSLISLISTNVQSQFTWLHEGNGKSDSTKINILVKTYSGATLHNTERIIITDEPNAQVFRYVKITEVRKVFEQRKIKCLQFTKDADKAKTDNRLADALRNYYWALVLLRSIPDGNTVVMPIENRILLLYLKEQIEEIFAGIKITVINTKAEENIITYQLEIKNNNQLVLNFDYTYWDGKDWSTIISAKDGKGFADFSTTSALDLKDIKIKAEYIFENEIRIDKELETVLLNTELVPFRNSLFSIPISNNVNSENEKQKLQNTLKKDSISINTLKKINKPQKYIEIINEVVVSIKSRQYQNVKNLFTIEGFEMYVKLIHYGKAQVVGDYIIDAYQNGDKVVCRSIPMNFSFENNSRKFVEDVIFYFDKDIKIEAVSFALNQKAISSIATKNQWNENDRIQLINFLEHFKTAYSLKRLDYLESIFSDNALIIVGNVLKIKPSADNPYKYNKILRFNHLTKQEYFKNLAQSFKSKEFINIKFEESIIKKTGKGGNIYGIQIKQNYFSSNYGDEGWLFLIVDLTNPEQPIIHVRTWQPEPNTDGSIFNIGDFQ